MAQSNPTMKVVPKMAIPMRDIVDAQENPMTVKAVMKAIKTSSNASSPPTLCELIGENDIIRPFFDWDYVMTEDGSDSSNGDFKHLDSELRKDFDFMKGEVWGAAMEDMYRLKIDTGDMVFAERHGWCPKHKENKISYRGYVRNMKTTPRNLRLLCKTAKVDNMHLTFDTSVYDNNKKINMVNCCKGKYKHEDVFITDNRILTLKTDCNLDKNNPTIKDTFIQYIPNPDECSTKFMTDDIDEAEKRFDEEEKRNRPSTQIELNGEMSKLHTPSNIRNITNLINPEYIDDYSAWYRMGAALYNTGWENAFDVFDELSMRGRKYGGVREFWNSMNRRPLSTITLGTIHHYAKLSNPDEYERVWGLMKPKYGKKNNFYDNLEHVVLSLSPERIENDNDRVLLWSIIYNVCASHKCAAKGKELIVKITRQSPNHETFAVDDFINNIRRRKDKYSNLEHLFLMLEQDAPDVYDEMCFMINKNKPTEYDESVIAGSRPDEIHARNLYYVFEGKMLNTEIGFVMYDENTGLWTTDTKMHKAIVQKYTNEIFPMTSCGENGKPDNQRFASIFPPAYELASIKAPVELRWDFEASKGFLLFKNGVLDMANFVMLPKDPKYRFLKMIHRDFDTEKDYTEVIHEIFDRLLDKAYTIPSDPVEKRYIKRDFILEKLSRGAAGRTEDRQFMIIIGDTACGKGVLSRLITNALEEYANTFSGENLIATKAKAGLEDERQWTWLVKKCHCRLIFANEFEMDTSETSDRFNNKTKQVIKMSAGRMKKLVSGGDPIEMRLLNTNAITSANHSTPVFLCNDTPEVAGIDRAYLERANYVMADRTSGKDITEDTDQLFVGDSSINLIERDIEIMDGMIALMCERYKKTIDKGLMPRPDFVVAETIERTGANDTGEAWFKNNFQLYRDIHKGVDMDKEFKKPDGGWDWEKLKDDDGDWFMRTDTLYNWYMDDIGSISKKAFSTMLSMSFKLKHGIKKIDRKTINVWIGIRRIPKDKRSEFVDDDDDEDEDYHDMMMRTAGRRI